MCQINKVTLVEPDGRHTVKRYARLCENATANHTCPQVTYTDDIEEASTAEMPSVRTRSSHGSSSSNTLADSASSPASRPSSSAKPTKPRAKFSGGAVRIHRPKASGSDHGSAGEGADLRRLDPAIRRRPVVLNQGGDRFSPTTSTAGASRRAERGSGSQASSARPMSSYSTRSFSPTFSVSSSEPIYELRSPAIATDARSTSSRFSSRTSSGAERPPRLGQTRYRRHVSDDSIEEETATAESSFNTVVPDNLDTTTDIEDAISSDIEPGLAKARYREQMRDQQSRRHQSEMLDHQIEALEDQLSALKVERDGDSDRPGKDSSSSSRAQADKNTRPRRQSSTFSRQGDSKGKARVEGHLASDGNVISAQTSNRRSWTNGMGTTSSRSTASTVKGTRAGADPDPDEREPVPRPSQESGDGKYRRRKHHRSKDYRH